MEKKIRIQLYSEDGMLLSDRLVSQDTEFNSGPKEPHKGPLRVEFTLLEKEDIEKAKVYLDKLSGILPLSSKKEKKLKLKEIDIPEERENLLKEVLAIDPLDQDILIQTLRSKGFKFMMYDFLETFEFPIEIKDVHKEKYQWMLRCIKEAKNPSVDKYDPMLIFGIKMYENRDSKIVVYLNGKFDGSYEVELPSKPKEVYKKTGMIKFPVYMTEEEREKFRFELRQYQLTPEKEFSKFFTRWRPYVENIPELPQDKKVKD